jgi:hypothetical protein
LPSTFQLALEVQAGQSQAIDLVLLARRQVALQPDEAAVEAELGAQLARRQLRQNAGQRRGGLLDVHDQSRIGVERLGRQCAGEHHAVAVDDVGAAGIEGLGRLAARHPRLVELDEPQADRQKRQGEHQAGDQQARPAGLERQLADAVQLDGFRRV